MLSLWLDLRGKPVANDLTALLDLYGGVRKRFDKAGLPPPQGSAVTGVLHLLSDMEEEDGDDGGLSLLALNGDAVYLDNEPAGVSITAGQSKGKQKAAALEAIHREERLLLLGAEQAVLPLFEFSLAQAQQCRSTDGCETALLAEVRGAGGVRAIQRAESEDDAGVPLGLMLGPDPALWYMALST